MIYHDNIVYQDIFRDITSSLKVLWQIYEHILQFRTKISAFHIDFSKTHIGQPVLMTVLEYLVISFSPTLQLN